MSIRNPYAKRKHRQRLHNDNANKIQNTSNSVEQTKFTPIVVKEQSKTETNSKLEIDKNNNLAQVSADASALVISASDKAGMEGIDRSRIDQIILRESGNSLFIQQQRKRDGRVNERIQQMKQRLTQAKADQLKVSSHVEKQVDAYKLQHENASTQSRSICVVVDMDMFYMACELLSQPDLVKRPACVGRGMILTSNYCARRYGVRSAMPGFIGDKLVEELSGGREKLIHVKSDFQLYKKKSQEVREVLSQYDPNLRAYSLDEAYLNLGPYLALFLQNNGSSHSQIYETLLKRLDNDSSNRGKTLNDPLESMKAEKVDRKTKADTQDIQTNYTEILDSFSPHSCFRAASQVVADMRRRVHEVTGLTCSAGLAPNFMLAKIASDRNKPNGQLALHPTDVLDFIQPLPTRKIPGIGRVTEKLLHAFDISTVRDLYEQRGLIHFLFQPATASFLLRASLGCDSSSSSTSPLGNPSAFGTNDTEEMGDQPDDSAVGQKGLSRERTFAPEQSCAQLNARLEDIARLVAQDLIRKNVWAHTITVKAKLQTYDVLSRCRSLPRGTYIRAPEELVAVATELLKTVRTHYTKTSKNRGESFSCRLLGIRCSNLIEADDESRNSGLGNQLKMEQFLGMEVTSQPVSPSKAKIMERHFASSILQESVKPNVAIQKTIESHMIQGHDRHDDISSRQSDVFCPVCNIRLSAKDNEALNRHIDSCLNAATVRQAVQDASEEHTPKNKKQRLVDFW